MFGAETKLTKYLCMIGTLLALCAYSFSLFENQCHKVPFKGRNYLFFPANHSEWHTLPLTGMAISCQLLDWFRHICNGTIKQLKYHRDKGSDLH